MEGQSLREICSADDMPARSTVHLWLLVYKDFSDQYTRAREIQAHTYADEIIDIADNANNDWMERFDERTGASIGWTVNGNHILRDKVRIGARQWFVSKMLPKKYGDKPPIDDEGNAEDALPVIHVPPVSISDEQWLRDITPPREKT